jgi:alanyl-tRNA synthetase
MHSEDIREAFLTFFEGHDHLRIQGAGVVPANDPTLLFVNSGMAPLKAYFTGEQQPPHPNLCNVQPCIRTKDIDDVGDRHHLTFFEMLGSWSIGEYFKDRAVELAFELLTSKFGFDPAQLYVTVFSGDDALGIPADEESAVAWERVGMARDHIVPLPAADNFWGPAGDSGPCGPCTEVFLDTGDAFGPAYVPGSVFDTQRRYIEIWNAGVFMQFDKGLDGVFRPLPIESVDTGSGLERVDLALNGLDTVYESDLLTPILRVVQEVLGEVGETQPHHRLLTDHVRASVVILSERVEPSNEGRGYIPRRLIRKCVTTAIGRGHDSFEFAPVVDAVIDRLGRHYPHLVSSQTAIQAALRRETKEFSGVVRRGMERLESFIGSGRTIGGGEAFQLFATYGLPVEITRELAAQHGVEVSMEEFQQEFRQHQEVSRKREEGERRRLRTDDTLPAALSSVGTTAFIGYEQLRGEGRVVALFVEGGLVERVEAGQEADLILDRTPFYGEGGGQIGDSGWLEGTDARGAISDTVVHSSGRYIHRLAMTEGALLVGDTVRLSVDEGARALIAANHTATHLLNAAVREVLGSHVHQAGSLVEPERLRFDFTHPQPVTAEELAEIEQLVNAWTLRDASRRVEVMEPDAALASGALVLRGEVYKGDVRVVAFGDFSKELCGGTHVDHTSSIGSFRILSEGSIAAGVRRVNAVTRKAAVDHSIEQSQTLQEITSRLRTNTVEIVQVVDRLVKKKAAKGGVPATEVDMRDLEVGDLPVTVGQGTPEGGNLRSLAQHFAASRGRLVMLWGESEGKGSVAVAVPQQLAERFTASDLVRQLVAPIGGSGGGNETLAQGGVRPMPADAALEDRFVALLS